jgi:C-terminal processing protease CtpA/Prc
MYKDYEDAGIGITFSAEYLSIPNGWSVQKVQIEGMYPEGPAAKAGIQNGDEIIALDGVHVQTFESTAAIAAVLTDPKKMDIEITTMRDGIVKVWKLKKSRFACMYQEEEEIRNNEKRFFTSRDFEGTAWACTCTNVDGLD